MTLKRQRCDDCGKRDGDRAADGRILLVFEPGMEGDPKLCAPCIEARRPTFLDLVRSWHPPRDCGVRERYARKLAALQPVVEHLSRTVGGFDPFARSVPFTFVDPLEQLELGRELNPWQREMCRRFGRNDPWVKKNVLGDPR